MPPQEAERRAYPSTMRNALPNGGCGLLPLRYIGGQAMLHAGGTASPDEASTVDGLFTG